METLERSEADQADRSAVVTRLIPSAVAKPWGRRDLAPWWPDVPRTGTPIGEIWFEHPDDPDPELLVKLLFTSARLSVQVHPDDARARAAGFPRGKDEAWVVLDAKPPAEIGMGLSRALSPGVLAAAARDGTVEQLIDWRPVRAGDAFYSPAGVVHALGATLTVVEVQQNADLTYRLYDYGSDRPLDVERAVAAATAEGSRSCGRALGPGQRLAASGPKLQVETWTGPLDGTLTRAAGRVWLFAAAGTGSVDGQPVRRGECLAIDGAAAMTMEPGAQWIIGYARAQPVGDLFED